MNIQIDSREKARAIRVIVEEFDRRGVHYFVSKLYVGDYMNYDNPRLIIRQETEPDRAVQQCVPGTQPVSE